MGIDLPLIWAVIIIFGIMMYVVMDGFDLGIGILFPFMKESKDRDVMMNTVHVYYILYTAPQQSTGPMRTTRASVIIFIIIIIVVIIIF